MLHTQWYLRYDEIACWKCRICKRCKHTSKWTGKPIWIGLSSCYQCRGVRYRHTLGVSDWPLIGYWTDCDCPIPRCFIPSGTFVEITLRVGNVGPVTTQVDGTRMLNKHPSGQTNPSGLVLRSVINVIMFDLALDRSCAASIITQRS